MKHKKLLASLLATLAVSCLAGGAMTFVGNYSAFAEEAGVEDTVTTPTHNDTSAINTPTVETQAFAIAYDGNPTIRYGAQAYAGVSGPAWTVGSGSAWTECGSGSHPFGSNHGDGRTGLAVTFKVNSTVAGKAYLWLYLEGNEYSVGTLAVNGGEASAVNLQAAKQHRTWGAHDPSILEVTLVEGENTIVLTMGEDYTAWFHGFCVSPVNNAMHAVVGQKMCYGMGMFTESHGDMAANPDTLGLNAFDNSADWGKSGGATYQIYAPTAGEYNLGFYVLAGAQGANRAKFTLNGTVLTFGGNEYYAFDTAAGWSGDSWNVFTATLKQGINTLKIENSLADIDGALKSNWWMHQISVERVPQIYLELDTSNVQRMYNPGRPFTAEGLVVNYMVDGQATVLTEDQYTVSTPDLSAFGSKEVTVTMKDTNLTASYSVAVGNEGTAFEGKMVEFDGVTSTGRISYYANAAIKGEGTGDCAGRIFWIIQDQKTVDGFYTIGSGGEGASENRQITLTLKINNTGAAGTYLIKSYANANNFEHDYATITVNSGEARQVNVCSAQQVGEDCVPYIFEVELVQGENTVEIKAQNQYSIWWKEFEVCAIDATIKSEYSALEGIRAGIDCMETSTFNAAWYGLATDRSLSYYLNVTAADVGVYTFTLKNEEVAGKKATLSLDGQEMVVDMSVEGETAVSVELTEGLHKVTIACSGADGEFDFYGFSLEKFVAPDSIAVDTSAMKLTLENGEALNLANLVVTATYGTENKELAFGEYAVEYPADYEANKAGTYEMTVYVVGAEEVKTTFDITVKAVKEVTSIEVNAAGVKKTLNVGEALNTAELVVKAVYNDGTKETLFSNQFTVKMPEGYDSSKAGKYTVTVEYKGFVATFEIEHVAASDENKEDGKEEDKTPESSGCGSVVGASMAAILGLGVAMVALKKKED